MNTLKIPISNHDSECFVQYNVEYKRSDETEYNSLYPAPTDGTILIPNLLPGDYNIRIVKLCCNGSTSKPFLLNYTI